MVIMMIVMMMMIIIVVMMMIIRVMMIVMEVVEMLGTDLYLSNNYVTRFVINAPFKIKKLQHSLK